MRKWLTWIAGGIMITGGGLLMLQAFLVTFAIWAVIIGNVLEDIFRNHPLVLFALGTIIFALLLPQKRPPSTTPPTKSPSANSPTDDSLSPSAERHMLGPY